MKYNKVVEFVNEILSQYTIPLTLRQVFYRLVANYGYPNKNSTYGQLSKQLVKARIRGDIDATRIEDRSREFLGGDNGFDSLEEFLKYQINAFLNSPEYYSRNMWVSQPEFVIVWIEKDALSRVVSNIADKYTVTTAPSRGYASYTYIKKAIERLPNNKKTTILHFADHDPSGLDMTRDIQERFKEYSNSEIKVERIALSYDQVQKYSLAPNPTKTLDPRFQSYVSKFGNECWELDAIEPTELQRLVSESIRGHIDVEAWRNTKAEQEEERQKLEQIFTEIGKKFQEMGLF